MRINTGGLLRPYLEVALPSSPLSTGYCRGPDEVWQRSAEFPDVPHTAHFLSFDNLLSNHHPEPTSRARTVPYIAAMVQHPDPKYMRRAIELSAKAGIEERTGGVFGAVLVRKETGEIVGEGYNREWVWGPEGFGAALPTQLPHMLASSSPQASWPTMIPLRRSRGWFLSYSGCAACAATLLRRMPPGGEAPRW